MWNRISNDCQKLFWGELGCTKLQDHSIGGMDVEVVVNLIHFLCYWSVKRLGYKFTTITQSFFDSSLEKPTTLEMVRATNFQTIFRSSVFCLNSLVFSSSNLF